jgi:hypothetical protein
MASLISSWDEPDPPRKTKLSGFSSFIPNFCLQYSCEFFKLMGCNLITDSGSFNIRLANMLHYTVRDFTEVGWMNLRNTYTRVGMTMVRNKKDGRKEEE